jgi:hypothetical protein
MNTHILVNELIIGELGSDRLTTVPFTTPQAEAVYEWFHRTVNDEALYFMLEEHPVLPVNEDVQFERVEGPASPHIVVRFPNDTGYLIYVPQKLVRAS